MNLFVIDEEKCAKDGLCAAVCPRGLIQMKFPGQMPIPIPQANQLCTHCGHCVAVCPHGAMSHSSMTPEQCPPLHPDWLLDPQRVEHFLRSRRSIRNYKSQTVQRSLLSRLIDIARFAPSGANSQPVRWHIIYNPKEVFRLSGMVIDWMRYMEKTQRQTAPITDINRVIAAWDNGEERICRGAPHVIVTHAPKNEPSAQSACIIALAYLELAAPSFGLGACWAGFFNAGLNQWPPLMEALGLPQNHISYGAMMIGYPMYRYHRLPIRNDAKIKWHE